MLFLQRIFVIIPLMFTYQKNKYAAWLGILALLLVSFAPLISHALELPNSESNQVICTQNGVKQLPNQAPLQSHGKVFNHCAYCSLATDQQLIFTPDSSSDLYLNYSGINHFAFYQSLRLASFYPSDHPSQAPPFSFSA
jgi:hypothetical protein